MDNKVKYKEGTKHRVNRIYFTKGYKYRLEEFYENDTGVVGYDIDTLWIKLTLLGR